MYEKAFVSGPDAFISLALFFGDFTSPPSSVPFLVLMGMFVDYAPTVPVIIFFLVV
jgi:hypothetical protein